jgi:hypothetical protein
MAIESHLRLFVSNRHIFGIFFREQAELLDRISAGDIHRLMREYQQIMAGILEEGVREGAFTAGLDSRLVTNAIFGMCNYTYKWYKPGGEVPIQEVARVFAALITEGLRKPEQ